MIFYNDKINVLNHKNKKFKKSKIDLFQKGVSPWFWSQIGHFCKFFLGNVDHENGSGKCV